RRRIFATKPRNHEIRQKGFVFSCFRGFFVSIIALVPACARSPEPADLVLRHGRVVTMDSAITEAPALAVRNGTIILVGTDEQVAARITPATDVIDLKGRLAIPGFIESHGHF